MDTNKSNVKKDPRVYAQTPQDMKWIKQETVDDFLSYLFVGKSPKKQLEKRSRKKKNVYLKSKRCIFLSYRVLGIVALVYEGK